VAGKVERRRATREKIVDAAARLFGQIGYHDTQVMDIVRAVGMSAGTFYKHFRDKGDLFEQLTQQGVDELRGQLRLIRDSLDVTNAADRRERLRESFVALFEHVDTRPQQVLMLLRNDGARVGGPPVDVWELARLFAQDLAEDASRWVAAGVVARRPPELFAHAVIGMSLQTLRAYLVDDRFDRAEAVDGLLDMTLAVFDACFEVSGA
jgi:AcrR family transcriptional regulator